MTIKRITILVLLTTICTFCLGKKVILLTKKNGVYTIPCSINGVKRSLVFDTGASTVTISMQLAQLLYSSGKLKDSDIKGYGRSQTASGHIVDNMAVVLRDIEIAGLHLKNVDAVIIAGQNVPLLLGLSAIQKLGKVTLSGNKLIIDSPVLANSQINEMRSKINSFIDNEQYSSALALLKKIEAQETLEERDLYNITLCYCYSKDNNKALMYCQQWMGMYQDTNSSHEADVCYFTGLAYMGLKSHYEADKWFAKAIELISLDAIERTSREDAFTLSFYYNQKALNYLEAKAYDHSAEAFDFAAQYRLHSLNYSIEDLCAGYVKDAKLGVWLESISEIKAVFLNDEVAAQRYVILAALCGNQKAIDTCKHFNLDYSPKK